MENKISNTSQGLSTNGLKNIVTLGQQLVTNATYKRILTRKNPTAFVLLLDQSGSMDEGAFDIDGKTHTKATALAHYINAFLEELINSCTREDGLRNYIDVCILGYGADSKKALPIWTGNLAGKTWVNIQELNENAILEEGVMQKVGRGGVTQEYSYVKKKWIEARADYQTPMGDALVTAYTLLDDWIRKEEHKDSFPPMVINFTDGVATDVERGKLLELAKKIQTLHTKDGNVLLYNCHLSARSESSKVLFPRKKEELPNDEYAHLLFEMSSEIPTTFHQIISEERQEDTFSSYYGMLYNADASKIAKLLRLGTTLAKSNGQQ